MKSRLFALFIILLLASRAGAQSSDPHVLEVDSTASAPPAVAGAADSATGGPSAVKLAVLGGVTAGGFLYGHVFLSHLWWKGTPSRFHFDWHHDWTYSLGADKIGHAYFPYLTANIYQQALVWAGLDSVTSMTIAAGGALAYQTYIEVRDGFSAQWGFSWGDWGADVIGAALPVAQQRIPLLRRFDFKISFYPSEQFRNGMYGAIIDDYQSTYHWLSVDVHDLLPEEWRRWYPAFINLAVGHSVKDLDEMGGGRHEFYLALDWNLKKLPGDGWFLRLLKRNLDYYHLPAPAVRISPGVVWYGLHF